MSMPAPERRRGNFANAARIQAVVGVLLLGGGLVLLLNGLSVVSVLLVVIGLVDLAMAAYFFKQSHDTSGETP